VLARPRDPRAPLHYPGLGHLRLQILRAPAFERTTVWEVYESGGRFALLRSLGAEPGVEVVVDHVRFDTLSDALEGVLRPFLELSIPVHPIVEPFGIADGTRLEIALSIGFMSDVRVGWPEGHAPEAWVPLERLAHAALAVFAASSPAPAA
jgi:hypothetical protein